MEDKKSMNNHLFIHLSIRISMFQINILFLFFHTTYSEAHDRTEISLPGNQEMLLQSVKKAAENKPFIVVLMSGGPVDISSAKVNNIYILTLC